MTTFATQVGYNGSELEVLSDKRTYFQLQKGCNGSELEVLSDKRTYFQLQKGYNGHELELLKTTYFQILKGYNGSSIELNISIGRIFLEGNLYTDTVTVTISSVQGNYTVSASNGYFPIYAYTDESNNPIQMYAEVSAGLYVGFLNFTPSPAGFFDINLGASSGMAVKSSGAKLMPFISQIQGNNFCYCRFECEYAELVFTDGGIDFWKNDKSSFLFQKYAPSDTIAFELWKAGNKIADITNSTYGKYYDFGDMAQQQNYKGVVIDWALVWALHGFGNYQFKASKNVVGISSTFESRQFKLMPYSDDLADGTVKIESWQNGNIIGSEFDFTGLNWYSSYRIAGKFGSKTPVLEVDNYTTSDYLKTQIQDRIRTEYTLQTKLLPSVVANALAYDQVLANRILLTDYNLFNHEFYRQVEVRPISIDSQSYEQNRGMSFAVKFEAVTDLRKRNF